jgi:serine/threonine protein kinase
MLKANGYRLIKKLGQGGFGEVWLAEDSNNLQVAIKFLLDKDNSQNFAREVKNLYKIDNQFVIYIFEHNLEAETPYFVMEYCEYGSLRDYCNKSNEWEKVANVLMNIIQGLHGIHKTKGFHRDIKPDNILIKRDENGKTIFVLSDLGLARVLNSITQSEITQSPHGTDAYKAPELSMPDAVFNQKCDIYSLGLTMIEFLTSKRQRNLKYSNKVPNELIDLLNKMVSLNPRSRPNLQQIAQTLNNLANPKPVVKQNIDTFQPNVSQQPSNGALLLGGLAILGIVALLAGGDEKRWDKNVGRYRGTDGKFRSD